MEVKVLNEFLILFSKGISNVKSREDLVMSSSTPEADPFGAAPFDPVKMRRHKQKQEQLRKQIEKQQELANNLLTTNIKSAANQGNYDFWA